MGKYVALILLALPALGQVNTAGLLGTVRDSSDAVIPGARITARNTLTNLERAATADADGNYLFAALSIGDYEIKAEYSNFATETRKGLVLAAGDRVRLDFVLRPGQVAEAVTVSGTIPLMNTVSPELGTLIDSQKVTSLPMNGRNFIQLVTLQPGVQSSNVNGRQAFNLNGLTQWGLNITLDGTDASFGESASFGDPSGRSVLNTVSVDSIQEFRVLAGTFTAETGRASGGAINIVTKGGANDYHGVLFYYLRNSALDARNFFAARKDRLVQNQFGATAGGPIKKDKLFFFGSFETARRRIGQQLASNVPTAAFRARSPAVYKPYFDLLPLPTEPVNADTGIHRRGDLFVTDENLGNGRLDYNTNNTVTTARYSINDSENSIPNIIPANRQVFNIRNHLLTLSNTWTISPAALNEVRLGFNRWYIPRLNSTFFGGLGEMAIPGVLTAGNFEGFLRFVDNAYTYADNFTYRRGRHTLKTGFELRRLQSNRIQKQNPVYSYNSVDDFMANRPLTVRVILGQPDAGLRQWNTGLYFQDDFQVHPRVMLNLGMRWEYYTPVTEAAGRLFNVTGDPFGGFRPKGANIYSRDLNNFNPRIGLAWDVTGKQRTVVRAGFGVYSSPLTPIFIWDTPTIDPRQPFAFNATRQDIPDLAFPISGKLAQAVANPDNALALGLLPPVVGRRIIDPNLRDTYSNQWNVAVQQSLSKNFVFQASYVGNQNLKAVNTRSVNLVDPVTRQRQDPRIGEILIIEDSGKRFYHGLQLSLRGRQVKGLTTDVFYTWGHSVVYGGDDCCTGTNDVIQDFDNIRGSRGDANTDIRQALTFGYSYDLRLDRWTSGGALGRIAGGWSIQGITQIRSGRAINILSGRDIRGNGVGGSQRPNYAGGSLYAANQDIRNWFNKTAFTLPAAGQYGNLGKNAARGPSFAQWDVSVIKNTRIFGEQSIQFRAEFFDLPNRANFGNPVASFVSPNFGQILSASPGRQIQLGLRYRF